jgi:uncharacterized RDD family membrane protein YckC
MINRKVPHLLIRTPEGVVFSLLLAGPISRFLALSVDLAAVMVVTSITEYSLLIFKILSADLFIAAMMLGSFIISTGYAIVMEWFWRGQTLGKMLLHLRVMDAQGLRLRPQQIIIRNLFRAIDAIPLYMVGGIVSLLNSKCQRLGDLAANTIVIRNPAVVLPDLDQLHSGKYNSMREIRHLAARLRQRTTPQEGAIAIRALERRDELEPAARILLFSRLSAYFQSLVEFPVEVSHGITDEQYVRNVVEILYQDKRPDQ